MHQNEGVGIHISERPVAAFQLLLLEMEVPPLRKRTQPAKVRAPKKLKTSGAIQTIVPVKEEVKVEEAPIVPDPEIQTWDKELDELFQKLRDHPQPPEKTLSQTVNVDDNLYCPLHTHVLDKKVSEKGWEYTRCQVKNCPIWLPWDQTLPQILLEVQFRMHTTLRQGLFYCQCQEPCKVGLTKKGPNRGRCFLTCAQKNAQRIGCKFFQWIDQDWSVKNAKWQMDLSAKFFDHVVQKEIKAV